MEQSYSVGTTNRYAMLIDDDDDPGDVILPLTSKSDKNSTTSNAKSSSKVSKEIPKQGKVTKAKENKEKAAQRQNKAVVLENVNKSAQSDQKPNSAGGTGGRQKQAPRANDRDRDRNDRREGGGERERMDNRRQNSGEERTQRDRPPRNSGPPRQRLYSKERDRDNEFGGGGEERQSTGGRGRGSRPFRERGGGRGGFRKREYERRSGSDKSSIKPVDKRDGGGAHNWGRQDDGAMADEWPNDEPEAQQDTQEPVANGENALDQKLEEPISGERENEESSGEEEDKVEEEPKEMTLDEYKAQQSVEFLKPDSSLQRNVDNSQWKGTVALKKEEEEFFPGTREVIEKPKTSGRTKTTLDPNFYFKDPARRGRGRAGPPGGGRGGGGGGAVEDRSGGNRRDGDGRGRGRRDFDGGRRGGGPGGRGGGRNFRRDRAPNVEDESDFPSLGAA